MPRPLDPTSRQRVLATAERLFHQRSYQAVSMHDIAEGAGIRKASLYHHVPGGKEALFVEVVENGLANHQRGLDHAVAATAGAAEAELRAVASWLIAHAPMGLLAMLQHDMPALSQERARALEAKVIAHLWQPVRGVFERAKQRGELQGFNPDTVTGAFLAMMDGLTFRGSEGKLPVPMAVVADELIAMILDGLRPRGGA